MHRMTVSMEKAQELAKEIPGLEEAVAQALEASWDAMTLIAEANADGTYEVTAEAPTGVMVAWMLPHWIANQVALPGGESTDDLHVTLAYLGDVADMTPEDQHKLVGVVSEVVMSQSWLEGSLTGVGTFENGDERAFWVGVDIPGIEDLHRHLVERLTEAGFTVSTHDEYRPHVTVAYLDEGAEAPMADFAPMPVNLDKVTVAVGPHRAELNIPMDAEAMEHEDQPRGWKPMLKAVETDKPERYTLAPMYVPDQLDAHNDWTDAKELQKSVWEYMRSKEFDIRLQHNTDIVAGECVELLCWPYEVTVPLTKADGTTQNFTYPPGTPFLGTVWNEWAWRLVQEGKLNGYSIGGTAELLEVDLGQDAVAKAKEASDG